MGLSNCAWSPCDPEIKFLKFKLKKYQPARWSNVASKRRRHLQIRENREKMTLQTFIYEVVSTVMFGPLFARFRIVDYVTSI